MFRTSMLVALAVAGVFAALAFTTPAVAQTQDVFSVAYYTGGNLSKNPPSVDGSVRTINTGVQGQPPEGFVCADIYVFDPHEELKECCSCPVSADGLLTIPTSSLTDNPANGVFSATGAIKIVADNFPNCNAAGPIPTPELRSWITNPNGTPTTVTESEFEATPLSSTELSELALLCSFIPNQSGPGVCRCS